MNASPISPELFGLLAQYARDVLGGRIQLGAKPRKTSPVIVFCQSFYAQFFENVIGTEITAIDLEAKRASVRARHRLKEAQDEPGIPETILLLTWFERFCDIYADVLALGYGGLRSRFVDFLRGYVEKLLVRSLAWANAQQLQPLAAEMENALTLLRQALKEHG